MKLSQFSFFVPFPNTLLSGAQSAPTTQGEVSLDLTLTIGCIASCYSYVCELRNRPFIGVHESAVWQ